MTDTTSEKPVTFFAAHKKVYPKAVEGNFRRLKWAVLCLCLGLYYAAPFLRWNRGLHAPDQAILIDLPHRRAYFFMIEIWPQEVYYLTGVLILAAMFLFFATSLFGRVWCGYLCFQTVWTDLFMLVERKIQGDRNARIKLDQKPWSLEWVLKKAGTHVSWLLIGALTGGAFVLYFNDAPTLISDLFQHGKVSTTVLGFVGGLTLSTYVMAGLAREQVCIFMCPYARFQSAMLDRDSLIVTYDPARGEPRGAHKKGDAWGETSHCVDCGACVHVCPTGIDIRNGLQMQCIACALCIDACDSVMDKLGLPRGLVRYDTERDMELKAAGQPAKFRFIRPRTIYYTVIVMLVSGIMLYGLLNRAPAELHVLHDRDPLFVMLSDGSVRNGYTIKILNKTHEDQEFSLSLSGVRHASSQKEGDHPEDTSSLNAQPSQGEESVPMSQEDASGFLMVGEPGIDLGDLQVQADAVGDFRVFLTHAATEEAKPQPIEFFVTNKKTGEIFRHHSKFVGKMP